MFKKIDFKMCTYCLGAGLLAGFIRTAIHPTLPDFIGLSVGFILFVIALVITGIEIKEQLEMFYAYGENWRGSFFSNSAFIFGLSNFFFATGRYHFALTAIALAIIFLLARGIVRKTSRR